MSSRLANALDAGRFVVTSELTPPKGTDLGPLFAKAELLAARVDAFNLTDCHGAKMSMAPMAVAHLLLDRGIEPILQMTARDRNRMALQSEMLAAHALGIHNVVIMTGDPPSNGDHPDAKPVFDLKSNEILAVAGKLNAGTDLMGNTLKGHTDMLTGAVANPGADDMEAELAKLGEKLEAGARFFQTQAIYDVDAFMRFAERAHAMGARLLAGIIPLKSPALVRFLNDKVPGISVPPHLVKRVDAATDSATTAVAIAAETIAALSGQCHGVHIMAIGWEDHLPAILEASGIASGRTAQAAE